MPAESPEARENGNEIDLTEVPDWHREPGTGLWEFGRQLSSISVDHESRTVEIDSETQALRQRLIQHETPTFFSGPFANVEKVRLTEDRIEIDAAETDFFSYLASAYKHRDDVGQNPIRPLAVQATLFNPDGSRMIVERRSENLADFPGKLSVFGGALKPKEDPGETIVQILNRKLGLDLTTEQVHLSGLVRENIDNIYCLTYTVRLNEEQFEDGRKRATAANRSGDRMFYQIKTDEDRQSIEQMFRGKRPISEWDPNAFYNLLYGLDAEHKRSSEELSALVADMRAYMTEHPMQYTYPIEKYLQA